MAAETAQTLEIHGSRQSRDLDRLIADQAESQHGVITRQQLLELGLGVGAVEHRLARGRLHIVHRCVYAVGHRSLTPEGRWMAAVLAAGRRAVASHRCAAAIWRLLPSDLLEVTIPVLRKPRGIVAHNSQLPADEVTHVRWIPVTTAPRTVLDLATVVPMHQVERAMNEAEFRRLADGRAVAQLGDRYAGRRGMGTIKSILEAHGIATGVTRSELESRFLRFLRKAGLPLPRLNVNLVIDGRWLQCDCVWHAQRVIVELDGRAAHATAAAFERDRARDRVLAAHGWRVVRVTWRQLHSERHALAADLRMILR
jgi:very-short-patch-repair endonuclease